MTVALGLAEHAEHLRGGITLTRSEIAPVRRSLRARGEFAKQPTRQDARACEAVCRILLPAQGWRQPLIQNEPA